MFDISYEFIDKQVNFTKIRLNNKLEIIFSNLGASIFEIKLSDKSSRLENILVSPMKEIWLKDRTFAGSIVGPLAGRYAVNHTQLEKNRPPIHFHGGSNGWDKHLWEQSIIEETNQISLTFSYFHLNYDAYITYTIDSDCNLMMEIDVQPKIEMYINPTNHMYFNLNGSAFLPVTNHLFQIDSNTVFSECNGLIQSPFPDLVPESLDFHTLRSLNLLEQNNGINHTFQFGKNHSGILKHPTNGRQVIFKTTLPSVVIYTFNSQQETFSKNHVLYPIYSGITFETQYPANQLGIVTFTPLHPYYSKTTYNFSVKEDEDVTKNDSY
ncbi:aldose epimerase family protein [Enterococcus dongliensis]|uniref:aldose epimerase family protein n=2 Tax=Enterococcus dongliensis TaxID=2559925 RepID=UPI00288F7411|nr:hypothetical protein [Enterococcus dongliensis]MDT2672621.1 hypothetical protein [Enterococcus dongliensis]MDT2712295.1 hypothetical protein [Enterococcus dongliensis]